MEAHSVQNSNESTIKNIISKCDLIKKGSPSLYKLKTKIESIGTLKKVTFGKKDSKKTNKTILLVGEAGAGKSTLVNALINHMMGVKFEDEVWFQIVEESQTSDVIVYQIFGFEGQTLPYSLTIINTPGFGDTREKEHDVKTNQQILQLFQSEEGVHELHAVGLVMKASQSKFSDGMKSLSDSLMSLFGKDLEKHVLALITHSDGKSHKTLLQILEAAKMKCSKDENNQPAYFLFDNQQDEDRTEETETFIENGWRVTDKGMKQFTAFLDKSSPLQVKHILEEQIEQIRLTACIQNLKHRIKFTELKQRDIRETQEALSENESEITKNQKFAVDVPEVYKDLEQITDQWCELGYEAAVYCSICEENCHYPGCTVALKPEQCEVMREGKCTSCTNKCPASAHVKHSWRYVIRTRKDQKTKKTIKQKYKLNQTGSLNKFSLSQHLENQMKQVTAEKSQLVDEVYEHFIKLAQNEDPVSAYVHLDFLMKKMKERGDLEKLQELKDIKSRMDERARVELQLRMESFSMKHEDLISESVLVQSEPPTSHQLVTKKEMFGTLSRVTVGEKDETKTNKTILLVGETGAGKSTLVNALFNHIMGVKFEDKVWFQIVEEEGQEEEQKHQTESQTLDVIVYQIFGFEGKPLPYSLTIIDTPGFGSTKGFQKDVLVSQRLFDLFQSKEGVHEIHAVGLVMKATDNRLSDRLKNIFNSVMSLFSKDLEENIIALITHSDVGTPVNVLQALEGAEIKCAKGENGSVYFKFNNLQKMQKGSTEDIAQLKYFWDFSNENMDHLTEFLEKSNPVALITTVEVLNNRIQLKACIKNLQERIQLIEGKQTEIQQIQKALTTHENEMKKNENFTVEVDEVYKDKEDIKRGMLWGLMFSDGAVICPVCKENCHHPCTMAWYPSSCKIMKKSHCTVCTSKCHTSKHEKKTWKYVTKTRRVQMTLEDVKKKYETKKAECEKELSLLENLEKETRKLTTEKSQSLDEAYKYVIRLEQIALKEDTYSTLAHLDFLIEKMKERGDAEKVQKLEELNSRHDKEKVEVESNTSLLEKTSAHYQPPICSQVSEFCPTQGFPSVEDKL